MSTVPVGIYSFGPGEGRLLVKVFREGVAAMVGHDLVFEARSWHAKVVVEPDPGSSTLEASVDVASLSIVDAIGGAKPLSRSDHADIKKNIEEKILSTRSFPSITFQSTGVSWDGDTKATVSGDLSVIGAIRPVDIALQLSGGQARASFTVVQSRWGIKPFKALMGALKVRDAVEVTLELPLPAA